MTENVDTYVLPAESVKFLSEVLPASNPLRITWKCLPTRKEKGICLRRCVALKI